MEQLLARRRVLKGRITRLETAISKHETEPMSTVAVNAQLDKLKQVSSDCDNLESEIGLVETDMNCIVGHEVEFDQLNERLMVLRIKLTELLPVTIATSISATSTGSVKVYSDIKLPKLELPIFGGSLNDWLSFHDLFSATVHNNKSLSGAQKLQYLKASLKGDAANLIQTIQVTDANYTEAWDILVARFQNKREIVNAQLKRMFTQPAIPHDSPVNLRKLLDTTSECVRASRVLGLLTDQWDPLLVYLVTERLDLESRREWELSLKGDELASFETLSEFIIQRARALAAAGTAKFSGGNACGSKSSYTGGFRGNQMGGSRFGSTNFDASKKQAATILHNASKSCLVCNKNHPIFFCDSFKKMSVVERWQSVKQQKLCFNCLAGGHSASECSKGPCKTCKENHNTLLHQDKPAEKISQPDPEQPIVGAMFSRQQPKGIQVLLSTCVVKVRNSFGQYMNFRALLDNGSQASFVTENCVQKLGVKRQRTNVSMGGLGETLVGTAHSIVRLSISSCVSDFLFGMDSLVLPKITSNLPQIKCEPSFWSHIRDLQLADPTFNVPGPVDILIGADHYNELLLGGLIPGDKGAPIAQETRLGWVLSGRIESSMPHPIKVHHTQVDLDFTLRRFWELEELPAKSILTPEERNCEDHFVRTHTRNETGRYIVQLPVKENTPELGHSYGIAVQRFKQVERRLQSSPDKKEQYVEFMREYISLGHMEEIKSIYDEDIKCGSDIVSNEINKCDSRDSVDLLSGSMSSWKGPSIYYVPHHFVLKESSTTTKFRVVFDASAKSSSGSSLNDKIMCGPKLQDDLVPLLIRFRIHAIALSADIAKMYRQVLVHPTQTNLQRIVWRESPDIPMKDYKLLTVTYGTASAPYLATRCIQQLAHDECIKFPIASPIAMRDFYVDDLLSGASDRSAALVLQSELIQLMKCGGFDLRKWSSNDEVLLQSLPPEYRETKLPLRIDVDESIKTLGIRWNPASDQFTFTVNLPHNPTIATKRSLLSDLSKVFDPLGWLSPTTITAKIIFQQLWLLPLMWDDPLPQKIASEWSSYVAELPLIQGIQIPRRITSGFSSGYQLHGFCDASERAYAAVVYLRSEDSNGQIGVTMITGKTKVSPIKQVSLPRLELCGAVLLARLISATKSSLNMDLLEIHAWTDSTVVLAWLQGHPNRWKTFVANRISEIQDLVSPNQWHHVVGEDNPADCASRGISASELQVHQLWWHGPSWLCQGSENWPNAQSGLGKSCGSTQPDEGIFSCDSMHPDEGHIKDTAIIQQEERKTQIKVHFVQTSFFTDRFSSLSTLKRVTAYCLRFVKNAKLQGPNRKTGFLTREELHIALLCCIKYAQKCEFSEEINNFVKEKEVSAKSRLRTLNPYLDKLGLIRVGGRLQRARIPEDQKHPIILPRKHHITNLIISYFHLVNLHAGPQQLLAAIQQQFWVIGGRDVVRRFVRQCIICHRHRAEMTTQMMGNLPAPRVNQMQPFIQCGVDYGGPFLLRVLKGRGQKMFKGWIALFICFATRAIHLELVSDNSASSVIAALKRFTSRRGKSADIFSDCGTNFVGANKELKEFLKIVKAQQFNQEIAHYLANQGINWHFNPPGAPHFGGIWEAGVKSVKFHLKRIVGQTPLTFEEMSTILCQIEACLNSRPICPMSSDPSDLSVLTPGHFLIGGPLTAIPEPDYKAIQMNRLSRWQLTQQLFQHFWKRWSREYLSRLQQRPKWLNPKENIKIGDLVLIKDDQLPPLKWQLGRITELHPGRDNHVRVVTIKTSTGELKRPVVKVSQLPLKASE